MELKDPSTGELILPLIDLPALLAVTRSVGELALPLPLRGVIPAPSQLPPRHIQGFELAHPIIYPIYDLLEYVKVPVSESPWPGQQQDM